MNTDHPYFEGMVKQTYPSELQFDKANNTDNTDTQSKQHRYQSPFFDLHLSIANGLVSSKIYDTGDDFDFDIITFRFWMVTFLAVLQMVYIFRNLLGLIESAIMSRTSMREINV